MIKDTLKILHNQIMENLELSNHFLVQEFCDREAALYAMKIDEKLHLVVKPKPTWCPKWIYKKIIKESVEIIKTK